MLLSIVIGGLLLKTTDAERVVCHRTGGIAEK
jgi:hypothetical protein